MNKFKILSIDGGGVRGVLPARLIDRLGSPAADLYAGTSTGAIVAVGLAFGLRASDLVNFYWSLSNKVFYQPTVVHRVIGGLFSSQYDNRNLIVEMRNIFGEHTLRDLERRVLIPTFDLMSDDGQTWKPKFFHNLDNSNLDEKIVDVLLRTTAAPSYFPSYQGFIDGGIVANNPAMCALAQALDQGTIGCSFDQIRLLSLSTGRLSQGLVGDALDWGLARWMRYATNMAMEGTVDVAHYQCSRVLREHYFRLDPVLPRQIAIDDTRAVPELVEHADDLSLESAEAWLSANWH